MARSHDPLVVLALPPAAPERVRGRFAGLDEAIEFDLRFPQERTRAAVPEAIEAADIVLSGTTVAR